jgi:hypothetical protein
LFSTLIGDTAESESGTSSKRQCAKVTVLRYRGGSLCGIAAGATNLLGRPNYFTNLQRRSIQSLGVANSRGT